MNMPSSFQNLIALMKLISKDDWVNWVRHEFIYSEIRAMTQAANLRMLARGELFVEKTWMKDSQMLEIYHIVVGI